MLMLKARGVIEDRRLEESRWYSLSLVRPLDVKPTYSIKSTWEFGISYVPHIYGIQNAAKSQIWRQPAIPSIHTPTP